IARFEGGASAEGDVLLGADGARSRVRRELLPQAQRIDTDIIGVSRKVPLDAIPRRHTLAALFEGPTLVRGPRGGFAVAGALGHPGNHLALSECEEYVVWGF